MDDILDQLADNVEMHRNVYQQTCKQYDEARMDGRGEQSDFLRGLKRDTLRRYAESLQQFVLHVTKTTSNDDTQELVYENGTLRPLREGE